MKNFNLKRYFGYFFSFTAAFFLLMTGQKAFGYGLGISSHPFSEKNTFLTTEMVDHIGNGTGFGIQARLTKKLSPTVSLEGGAGFADGDLSGRYFAATEIEFYPDFDRQPRISLKTFFENAREFGTRRNIMGIVPVFAKGFRAWENDVYPFLGFPFGLTLNESTKSYNLRSSIALGMTCKLPMEGYEHLLVNVEGNINMANSYSGLFAGLSYPLQ